MNYTLPYLGNINLKDLKEYYHIVIEISKNNTAIDICFENKSIDLAMADNISSFFQNISKLDQHNRAIIAKDFEEKDSETYNYIDFYLNAFDKAALLSITGNNSENASIASRLLDKLVVARIGLYPDGKYGVPYFAVFDYTIYIDNLPCDQLLVVFTDIQGNVETIGWDS